jgi:hypothetical protein
MACQAGSPVTSGTRPGTAAAACLACLADGRPARQPRKSRNAQAPPRRAPHWTAESRSCRRPHPVAAGQRSACRSSYRPPCWRRPARPRQQAPGRAWQALRSSRRAPAGEPAGRRPGQYPPGRSPASPTLRSSPSAGHCPGSYRLMPSPRASGTGQPAPPTAPPGPRGALRLATRHQTAIRVTPGAACAGSDGPGAARTRGYLDGRPRVSRTGPHVSGPRPAGRGLH